MRVFESWFTSSDPHIPSIAFIAVLYFGILFSSFILASDIFGSRRKKVRMAPTNAFESVGTAPHQLILQAANMGIRSR